MYQSEGLMWYPTALLNFETSVLIQKHHPYTGNLKSEVSTGWRCLSYEVVNGLNIQGLTCRGLMATIIGAQEQAWYVRMCVKHVPWQCQSPLRRA